MRDRYLDLLKKCLTRSVFDEAFVPLQPTAGTARRILSGAVQGALARFGLELVERVAAAGEGRDTGGAWPVSAETMIGRARLDHLEVCIASVLADRIPGDLLEAGVWRGGATIFMRGALEAYGDPSRNVWVADSFAGLPRPNAVRYPADAKDRLHAHPYLAVPLEEVKKNFARYGLLDERVRFLPGFFRDSLPNAPVERLAVLRIDADMYESTFVALEHLYPRLSAGGFVVVDDYGILPACRAAVEDYRSREDVREPVEAIDASAVFWRRAR